MSSLSGTTDGGDEAKAFTQSTSTSASSGWRDGAETMSFVAVDLPLRDASDARSAVPDTISLAGQVPIDLDVAADIQPSDIEHAPVVDDPREWSKLKKNFVLTLVTTATFGPLVAPSIYTPVIKQVESELNATATQISLSISLYILFQGCVPIFWASVAEIVGRKLVYLVSLSLYTIGCVIGSRAQSISLLIGMRCLQGVGSSAVVAIGTGSLADMYELEKRGRKLGIYVGMPLLGPALGPLIGGALGNAFGWRSTQYFLSCFAGIMTLSFLALPDAWRPERSSVYQGALRRVRARAARGQTRPWLSKLLRQKGEPRPTILDVNPFPSLWFTVKNPVNAIILVCSGGSTLYTFFLHTLTRSGFLFGAQYTVTYTASLLFAAPPYSYTPLKIGLVLLSFGIGNIFGSIVGGRIADRYLRKIPRGKMYPELRIRSTMYGMPFMVAGILSYGWTTNFKEFVAGPIVCLFVAGFSIMTVYASTIAYIVDANPGRSTSAVSVNSAARGATACIMAQIAVPIRDSVGDGGLYTIVAGILTISSAGLLFLAFKGAALRKRYTPVHPTSLPTSNPKLEDVSKE